MSKNNIDQKGQGNPNDQNPVEKRKENTYSATASETQTKAGSAAREKGEIPAQGKKANQRKQDLDVSNLNKNEDSEQIKEYEDLEHPHKSDTPKASEKAIEETGENTIEGENQGSERITNKSEDKAFE